MTSFFAFLKGAVRAVVAFLLPILKTHAGNVLAAALPIAQEIVTNLNANTKLSAADKRALARKLILATLLKEGKAAEEEITTSLLNLAIEMAVQRVKSL